MSEKIKLGRPAGFFDVFERRPGSIKKNMHYCPGCGHGVLHKLIAEAIADLGITHRVVLAAPVGCAVFAYYYFNFGAISVPHGRAPAVGTGAGRANPNSYVISYQGDGDLAAIGFNEFIQAANRGERMTVFFVNNSNYGMTGGQMAPTTLPGQVTTTSPYGRNVETDGYPMRVCELINSLEAPVYIERVALTTPGRIAAARKAVFKAVENLRDRKGFSLVEVLSPCPVNLKMDAAGINEFIEKKMTQYFPIGVVRDRSAETPAGTLPPPPVHDAEGVKAALLSPKREGVGVGTEFKTSSKLFDRDLRIKVSGFGGQGILSLGLTLANMGRLRNLNASWMPSYGPEQRGGAASCSVIVSKGRISSPIVDRDCDLLVAMTQTALDKFGHELKDDGILVYDRSSMATPPKRGTQTLLGIDSLDIATHQVGNPKCANSVLLGALAKLLKQNYLDESDGAQFDKVFAEAITENFGSKPKVVEQNLKAYEIGLTL